MKQILALVILLLWIGNSYGQNSWQSKWIRYDDSGNLKYTADENGNIIPDFGRVGYHEGENPPDVAHVKVVLPGDGDDYDRIQNAIDEVAKLPLNENGHRGAVLLKNGTYQVSQTLEISKSGIVLRGEDSDKTILVATTTKKYDLIKFSGSGSINKDVDSELRIAHNYIPLGTKKILLESVDGLHEGDSILVYRPGTDQWIHDLKMDQIHQDGETVQWEASSYHLSYERIIKKISGDTIFLDHPVVMAMEDRYGGGYIYKYRFKGRISECGVENLLLKSVYASNTDENHSWNAIRIDNAQHCWIRNVTARYFAYSCVNIKSNARNVSVLNCRCLTPKSEIIGGRRYSFNCKGQLNLFKGCFASHGRHDFVTGSRVCGPNVFTQCEAVNAHSDIGPHHRWATGTLYDMITTDGEIRVQDRGDSGTGHGWAGANQVLWNCSANKIVVQNPWVSALNYCIGCKGIKYGGRFSSRPDGEWEGLNQDNLKPESLYEAQYAAWKNEESTTGIEQYSRSRHAFECYCFNHNLVIRAKEANEKVEQLKVYDLYGRMVCNTKPGEKDFSINISDMPKGIYFVCIKGATVMEVRKVIIKPIVF